MQVTNELHQTPWVSLSSISSQPNPGGEAATCQPPPPLGPPEPWLSALPAALFHRNPEKEPTARAGGRKQASPTGP